MSQEPRPPGPPQEGGALLVAFRPYFIGSYGLYPLILLAFTVWSGILTPILTHPRDCSPSAKSLTKCTIYYGCQFCGLIILHLGIYVHCNFTVFVPCQILHRLGIHMSIYQVGDVSMA